MFSLQSLLDYMAMGGFVMVPLVLVSMLLWYGLTMRALTVKASRKDPRKLLKKASKGKPLSAAITARAAAMALEIAERAQSPRELKSRLNACFHDLRQEMNRYRAMVRSLVMVAPLLGLLGTVDGMIETFNSLGDMALFTQSGGIAGGISRALFTTQVGLAVSIPGLMIGRVIERRQMNISRELNQIRDLVCADDKYRLRS